MHPPEQAFPNPLKTLRRGLVSAAVFGCFLGLPACKDNLSTPPTGNTADTTGPLMVLSPGQDTLADSVGVLSVRLTASDVSGIKKVDFFVLPASSTFGTLTPLDTVFNVFYNIPLGLYKHGSFRFYARSTDILDHETVTDTVTVTVK
jgi:hypothetical protein